MKVLYIVVTTLFAYASYEVLTSIPYQPFVGAALGYGLGWFAVSIFKES
jgi:hypothetical protein